MVYINSNLELLSVTYYLKDNTARFWTIQERLAHYTPTFKIFWLKGKKRGKKIEAKKKE